MLPSDAIVRGRRSDSSYKDRKVKSNYEKKKYEITHGRSLRIEIIISNDGDIQTRGKTFSDSTHAVDFDGQCDGVLQRKFHEFILARAILKNKPDQRRNKTKTDETVDTFLGLP